MAKIWNGMEPYTFKQYTSPAYDKDVEAFCDKLAVGYHEALGLKLYYLCRSLF